MEVQNIRIVTTRTRVELNYVLYVFIVGTYKCVETPNIVLLIYGCLRLTFTDVSTTLQVSFSRWHVLGVEPVSPWKWYLQRSRSVRKNQADTDKSANQKYIKTIHESFNQDNEYIANKRFLISHKCIQLFTMRVFEERKTLKKVDFSWNITLSRHRSFECTANA